ncbi:MAG: hypothetical protein KDB22_11695 [Planctomycetales bacterium]|nr:hypothetical protein [Planctomycetales bacterium]
MVRSRKPVKRVASAETKEAGPEDRGSGEVRSAHLTTFSSKVQITISILVVLHFSILILSLSANLSPSFLQGKLVDLLGPYLITTGQEYGAVPIEITHAEPIDFATLVQVHERGAQPGEWISLALPGVIDSTARPVNFANSRWTNLSRLLRLIAEEFNDSDVLAEFAASIANRHSQDMDIDAIRILAPHVPSYDKYEELRLAGLPFNESTFPPVIAYYANVVAQGEQLRVIPYLEPLRTSKPVSAEEGTK